MPSQRFFHCRLGRLKRAEYWWQPAQLVRRTIRHLRPHDAENLLTIRLPWGHEIEVDPKEAIGRTLVALNIFDLPTAETIWRLLDDGDVAVDVGANIGFMTALMAARLKQGGAVWAFEPQPHLFGRLERNVSRWRYHTKATIRLEEMAVAEVNGTLRLFLPPLFADNHGTATIMPQNAAQEDNSFAVTACTLDSCLSDVPSIGLLKVDVEGAEARVFEGAASLLSQGRIRDILFEEFAPYPARTHHMLQERGYTLFRVVRSFCRPLLESADCACAEELETPTYLATRDPIRARRRLAPRGWFCLR